MQIDIEISQLNIFPEIKHTRNKRAQRALERSPESEDI